MIDTLAERIKRHEGYRLTPYKDTEGILTVGYGRNLEAVPFSPAEVELMFETDLRRAIEATEKFIFYDKLNDARKGVLIEMIFQMGARGVMGFKKFRDYSMRQLWDKAADEMLDSKWATQTPGRAQRLAEIYRAGNE